MSNSFSRPAENGKECTADITFMVIDGDDNKIVGVLAIIEKNAKAEDGSIKSEISSMRGTFPNRGSIKFNRFDLGFCMYLRIN